MDPASGRRPVGDVQRDQPPQEERHAEPQVRRGTPTAAGVGRERRRPRRRQPAWRDGAPRPRLAGVAREESPPGDVLDHGLRPGRAVCRARRPRPELHGDCGGARPQRRARRPAAPAVGAGRGHRRRRTAARGRDPRGTRRGAAWRRGSMDRLVDDRRRGGMAGPCLRCACRGRAGRQGRPAARGPVPVLPRV